jgi:hypothetical protein
VGKRKAVVLCGKNYVNAFRYVTYIPAHLAAKISRYRSS